MSDRAPEAPPQQGIGRRTAIKRGLFGGALLAVGGAGALASRSTALVPLPAEGLQVLSPAEYAVVDALARRLIVPVRGPSVDDIRVAFNVDRVLVRASPDVVKELKQLLGLFDNALAGFLFTGGVRPFTRMAPQAQDAVLRDWRDSALALRRTGFQALRTLIMAAYYGDRRTWEAASYPGPPRGFHQPDAPSWRGGDAPRTGLGVWVEPPPEGEDG